MKLGIIAEKIGALLDGNFELEITGLGSLDNCNEGDITFLSNMENLLIIPMHQLLLFQKILKIT